MCIVMSGQVNKKELEDSPTVPSSEVPNGPMRPQIQTPQIRIQIPHTADKGTHTDGRDADDAVTVKIADADTGTGTGIDTHAQITQSQTG